MLYGEDPENAADEESSEGSVPTAPCETQRCGHAESEEERDGCAPIVLEHDEAVLFQVVDVVHRHFGSELE